MQKLKAGILGLALAAISMTGAAVAEPIVIKIGHSSEAETMLPGAGRTAGVNAFKHYIESQSHGEMVVEVHPNGSLGNGRAIVEQAQLGVIQVAGAYTSIMVPFAPEIAITQIPYVFDSNLTAWKVMEGPVGQELAELFLKNTGLRVLGWADGAGFRNIYAEKPVKSPKELEGMTMRVPENPGLLAMFRAWGSKTVTITWSELYTALQAGMAEGHDTELYSMYSKKLYEVNPHVTVTRHSYNMHPLMMNEDFFQSLSPEHQNIVLEAADLYTRVGNAHSYLSSLVVQEAMEKEGAKFYFPTSEEIEQFRSLGQQPYIDTIVRKIGDDGQAWVDKILAAAEAAREGS